MSSHHIVRDEQEPAILITEIKKAYWPCIQQLLEWTPTIIVIEECVHDVLLTGIKIDIVICEEGNLLNLKEQLKDHQPIQFVLKEDGNAVSIAVDYLKGRGYKGVNIFGSFDSIRSLAINDQIIAIWYDAKYRYILSSKFQFQKWMPKDHLFTLWPTEKNQSFEFGNIEKVDHSNSYICTDDGKVLIDSNAKFWLGEFLP